MLSSLGLSTPPLGPPPVRTASLRMRVEVGPRVALPSPWVAYALPWHRVESDRAVHIAEALDGLGIAVAGLRSELGSAEDKDSSDAAALTICPYRGDRYGLSLRDLQSARIIELRLTPTLDASGVARYSAEQMRRWGQRSPAADQDLRKSGGIHAAAWPPDVADVHKIGMKVEQLRQLAPRAMIAVSLGTDHIDADLQAVVDSGTDIVTLRAERWPESHADALATLVARVRERLDDETQGRVTLLVVPPKMAVADDLVKMLALGANLVAIDAWCEYLFQAKDPRISVAEWAAANLGVVSAPLADDAPEIDPHPLEHLLDVTRALVESTGVARVDQLGREHLVAYGATIPGVRSFSGTGG